jgi:hypothetical protein
MFDRLQRGRKKEGREGRGPPSILNTQKGREKKKRKKRRGHPSFY